MARQRPSDATYDETNRDAEQALAGVVPTCRRVAKGSCFFRQGDAPFGVFRLVTGRIVLMRVTPEGTQVAMHAVRPGELFAEASLFSDAYHCDAIAQVDCEVLVFSRTQLVRQFRANSDALWAFTAQLARQVQGLRTRLTLRQVRAAPERVLQSLRLRCDVNGVWRLDGTIKQFAEEIGLTHEACYRALASLERAGRIARVPGEIRLTEKKRLSAVRHKAKDTGQE